jgi:hypothetical protein
MRLLLISIIGGVTIASSALAQSGPQGADSTRAGRYMSAGCQRGASDSRRRPIWTVERQAGAIQRSYLSAGWIG